MKVQITQNRQVLESGCDSCHTTNYVARGTNGDIFKSLNTKCCQGPRKERSNLESSNSVHSLPDQSSGKNKKHSKELMYVIYHVVTAYTMYLRYLEGRILEEMRLGICVVNGH